MEQNEFKMEPYKKGPGYWIGIVVLLAGPAVSYGVFEWITGNLAEIQGRYLVMNLIYYYAFYMLFAALTNSVRIVYPTLNTILMVLALAEHFVLEFRSRPIMVWDVMAFRTAMTVSGNYIYDFTPRLILGIIISLGASVLAWKFHFQIRRKKVWLAGALASSVLFIGWQSAFFHVLVPKYNIDISMWDPVETYGYIGYMLCTMRSLEYLFANPPEGYSVRYVKQLGEELEAKKQQQEGLWSVDTDVVPANLICIMNESFSDLREIADFETDVPYLSYYEGLSKNCVKGNLYMPVWGSMTPNSEYEFLTGNSMAFAPSGSVPYQTYMNSPVYGLPRILKEQGYQTVAMHPYVSQNWNREAAYQALGFDTFYAEDFYAGEPLLRNYISDQGDYNKIIELTEQKEPGEPLFIFNVTMQNHGGYSEDYESAVHLTELSGFPQTEQYLSLIKKSDEALQGLLEYYSGIEEPTMIVMFGDHQPSVEPEFYEALYGSPLSELKPEDYLRRYATPFLVWTNYETPSDTVDRMSAQYLSGLVLERANLSTADYQVFLDDLYQEVPVVHDLGYYNSAGVWDSWTDWRKNPEYSILHQFDMLQYNNIFGKKNRVDSIFSLPGNPVK